MNNDKENIKWTGKIKPLLEGYLKSLFIGLETENIIIQNPSVLKEPIMYTLSNKGMASTTTTTTTTTTVAPSAENAMFMTLFDLRNIARVVYQNLDYPDSNESHTFPLSRILEKLEENKAFTVPWKDRPGMMKIFDTLEVLLNDPDIEKVIERNLKENNINPNIIITDLLEFYGHQKAIQHFGDANSQGISKLRAEVSDWMLLSHPNVGDLYFNFKLRKNDPVPDQQSLLEAIRQLEATNKNSFVLLVVFTYENSGSFDKLRFQFSQILLNDLRDYPGYTDKIKFIPISTTGLNAIDHEFKEFEKTYIQDHFDFIFKNQSPPRGFPDRNDHFLERTFDIRKTNFKILIEPVETGFWRFGFRFIHSEIFPPVAQIRHQNKEVGDIHIGAGDAETLDNGNLKWKAPNKLTITEYNVDLLQDDFRTMTSYQGNPVTLSFTSKNRASEVEVAIFANNESLGKKIYDLQKFKYCRLFAWCDQNEFELKTDIQILHNNSSELS